MGERPKIFLLPSLIFIAQLAFGCQTGRDVEPGAAHTQTTSATSTKADALASPSPQPSWGEEHPFKSTLKFHSERRFGEKVIEEKSERYKYTIGFSYPQLEGVQDVRAATFNRVVAASARKEVNDFRRAFRMPQEKLSPAFDDVYNSLDGHYEVIYATDELISIRFSTYTYGRGAAHSVQSFRVLNYDLQSNKTIKLSDLFKPGSKYLKFIADFCVGDFRKQNRADCQRYGGGARDCEREPDFWLPEYVTPTARNYQNWNITDTGLLMSFDACLIASCAAGEMEVMIPYAALDHLLSAGSIAASVAKGTDQ